MAPTMPTTRTGRPGFPIERSPRRATAGTSRRRGCGLIAAAWLARFLPTILYATSPTDVLSYVIPALLLVGMALAAGLLPARRATRITPAAVLKGP